MLRAVFDTNIFISSIFWKKGNPNKIVALALDKKIQVFTSLPLLQELAHVLRRDFNEPEPIIQRQLALILSYAVVVVPRVRIEVVKEDPEDNKVLECALSVKTDYVVSGDKHLLNLKGFKGVKIVSAKDFLEAAS